MRNFKYVKVIKDALEKECPSTVSCADIVALSARDGIVMVRRHIFICIFNVNSISLECFCNCVLVINE